MTASNFVKSCARSIYDPKFQSVSAEEWLEIMNFQGGELLPEIGYSGNFTKTISSLGTEYQIDLSSYSTLETVETVYLISDSNYYPYDNWVLHKELGILDLEPDSSKTPVKDISEYDSVKVYYQGSMPEITDLDTNIALSPPKLALLKKICIKEALYRILNDHAKLDRYRTLVGRMNEYALMSQIQDLVTEIELTKRKLINTNPVRAL